MEKKKPKRFLFPLPGSPPDRRLSVAMNVQGGGVRPQCPSGKRPLGLGRKGVEWLRPLCGAVGGGTVLMECLGEVWGGAHLPDGQRAEGMGWENFRSPETDAPEDREETFSGLWWKGEEVRQKAKYFLCFLCAAHTLHYLCRAKV